MPTRGPTSVWKRAGTVQQPTNDEKYILGHSINVMVTGLKPDARVS